MPRSVQCQSLLAIAPTHRAPSHIDGRVGYGSPYPDDNSDRAHLRAYRSLHAYDDRVEHGHDHLRNPWIDRRGCLPIRRGRVDRLGPNEFANRAPEFGQLLFDACITSDGRDLVDYDLWRAR